jgi:class 3 adenylate cyclase
VIAESTRKLVGNLFELEDLGAQNLKGIAGPVRGISATPRRMRTTQSGLCVQDWSWSPL